MSSLIESCHLFEERNKPIRVCLSRIPHFGWWFEFSVTLVLKYIVLLTNTKYTKTTWVHSTVSYYQTYISVSKWLEEGISYKNETEFCRHYFNFSDRRKCNYACLGWVDCCQLSHLWCVCNKGVHENL